MTTDNSKFLVSVGKVYGYDITDGTLLFEGKALLDSSLDLKLSQSDVRGGLSAPLIYRYYHSSEVTLNITDTQFNLNYIANTVGSDVTTGANVWTRDAVTLTGGAGTVTKTPVAYTGTSIWGWAELSDGTTEKVTFSGSNFTCSGQTTGTVYVRYLSTNAAAQSITLPGNVIPKVVRIVIVAQLASSGASTNRIGEVQFELWRCTLTGNVSISMKMDGVSTTPLTAYALRDPSTESYGEIRQVLDSSNWYDSVTALAVDGGDFTLANGATKTLKVWAIPTTGAPFVPPVADLSFTSDTTAKATIGLHTGLVTWVSAGSSLLHVTITSKNTIEASATVTTSA